MTAAHVAPSVTSRRTADLLLDAHRLSGLVGHPVRATRLRHKPNLSTVAALVSSDGDPLAGVPCWVQVAEPGHHGKIDKAVRRAADRGLVLHRIPVPDSELMLAHGTADTDPRLSTGLQDLSAGSRPIETSVTSGQWTVLRHNPMRRLVAKINGPGQAPRVLRITAAEQGHDDLPAALDAQGVPVIRAAELLSERVTVWPWFGIGDLAAVGSPCAAELAGEALARLHASTAPYRSDHGAAGDDHVAAGVASLEMLAADLRHLDPYAADRMGALVARLAQGLAGAGSLIGLCHGDFSADQVLVDDHDQVRLTDFDRASHGPVAADLGSFAATTDGTPHLMAPLLAGYRQAGGSIPAAGELRLWEARGRLTRILDPFRSGAPDWAGRVHDRLDLVAGLLR